jgi:hypothetical protein
MYRQLVLLATALAVTPAQAVEVARVGDLELHCVAVPSTELTPEAAKSYNVDPKPNRGLLTITILKKGNPAEARAVSGQVYAGALNQNNYLSSIPIREVREDGNVFYIGEFRLNAPDTLRFLVNANVLGKAMKSEFIRVFSAP